jgi:hypothetical protein
MQGAVKQMRSLALCGGLCSSAEVCPKSGNSAPSAKEVRCVCGGALFTLLPTEGQRRQGWLPMHS